MNKQIIRGLLAVGALVGAVSAQAAVTEATTAIATAQTDALTVAGALLGLSIAVWGANYIRRKFFGR